MTREILVHLNIEVPDDDPRSGEQVGEFIAAALAVGLEGLADADEAIPSLSPPSGDDVYRPVGPWVVALAEEI